MGNSGHGIRYWILWFVLLVFVWNCVVVVRTYDAGDRVSKRKEKLEELLRQLKTYPKAEEQNIDTSSIVIKNKTNVIAPLGVEYDVLTPLPTTDYRDTSQEVAQIPPPSVSSYEDFYRIFYGTEEGIRHLKENYGPEGLQRARAKYKAVNKDLEDVMKANEHFLQIRSKARCKTPVARLIRVKDYYPNPSRIYLPRCTLLHRCGETAGCCDSEDYECVPSTVKEVALHFYKLTVSRNGLGYGTSKNNIERLVFVNHTSCHCQPINDLPRMKVADRHHHQHGQYPLDGMPSDPGDKKTRRANRHRRRHHTNQNTSKCRECPVPFNGRVYRDGRCGCDCFDRQKPCLKIKRGKHPLNEVERRCVEGEFCHPPACEYGTFDVSTGYCPRRHDEPSRDNDMIPRRLPSSPRSRWHLANEK